jgi:CheY-like chemotaxis protein
MVEPGESFRASSNEKPRAGTYVCLEVADTGAGMTAETKARLFEPFFSTKFAGRGLGMAAVLGIVRGHHGAVQVHSGCSAGSEIEILFPAGTADRARREDPKAPAARDVSGTLLVVDDEESVRNVARAILERSGFRVITAAGGAEALAMLRDRSNGQAAVDAVLLDLVMPRMGGKEVLEEVRRLAPELPVIVSSGYSEDDASAGQWACPGPTRFLAKPYRPAELLEIVCGLLAGRTRRSE